MSILPPGVKYAVLTDAGVIPDFSASRETGIAVFNTHNSTDGLDKDCVAEYEQVNEEWRCSFAHYTVPFVTSPLFVLNSIHDTAVPTGFDPECSIPECSGELLETSLRELRELFHNATTDIQSRVDVGLFLDSCLRHCQSIDNTWYQSVRVEGQLARETFANWYFGGSGKTRVVDCEDYQCNDSCGNPRDLFGTEYLISSTK